MNSCANVSKVGQESYQEKLDDARKMLRSIKAEIKQECLCRTQFEIKGKTKDETKSDDLMNISSQNFANSDIFRKIKDIQKYPKHKDLINICRSKDIVQSMDLEDLDMNEINIISLLIKRIRTGKNIAQAKLIKDSELILKSRSELWDMITYPEVEVKVIENIASWNVELSELFKEFVIPETKYVQIDYILSQKD